MNVTAAVVSEQHGAFDLTEVQLDEPRPDEVRVRIVGSGVCHTDAIVRDQVYPTPLPAVLGHEGSGIVEQVGSAVTHVAPGDHVVMSMNSCGTCRTCRSGMPTYCSDLYGRNFGGRRADGSSAIRVGGAEVSSNFFGQSSFATHAIVAGRSVVPVPADAPLELLGPLGCGIQTGAGAVINTLRPRAGSTMAVFGVGAVGMAAVLASRLVGCERIVAVDLNADRLALAEELGATDTVDGSGGDAAARIQDLTGGAGVDYAIDATGVPAVLRQAAESLALLGTVGLVGAAPPGTETTFETGLSLTRGWTLRMIIEGDAVPQNFIPGLVRLWQAGRFPFDRLVQTYPFEQINDAFADSESGKTVKPVLLMS